jgi:hypothetical protein
METPQIFSRNPIRFEISWPKDPGLPHKPEELFVF